MKRHRVLLSRWEEDPVAPRLKEGGEWVLKIHTVEKNAVFSGGVLIPKNNFP